MKSFGKAFAGVMIVLSFVIVFVGFNIINKRLSLDTELNGFTLAEEKEGYQEIKMEALDSGYFPSLFAVKKGIPVKWKVNNKSFTCASTIASYDKDLLGGDFKVLSAGENVIEFMPTKTGALKFTCAIGTFPGQIKVIE